jgi:hypothetical protein
MNFKRAQIVYILFLLFAISIPFNTLYETIAFFKGMMNDKTKPLTPLYFKIFKDVFGFCAVLLIAVAGGFTKIDRRIALFYGIIVFVFVFALYSMLETDTITVLLGVRSYLSIIFILFGFYFHHFNPDRAYPAFRLLLVGEVVVQVMESIYAPDFYGMMYQGFNLANPGTFLIPSSMAGFAILVMHYAHQREDRITEFIALFSIFLARSSTAWLVVIFFYTILAVKRLRLSNGFLLMVVIVSAIVIALNLDVVTGRDAIADNLVTRWDFFAEHLSYPLGKGFGLGSGAAVLAQSEEAVIADSTISSLLINFGWISVVLYAIFIYHAFRVLGYRNLLVLAFAGFSLTMIIFEMTPFIQFFFFELGRGIYLKSQTQSDSVAAAEPV